MLLSLVVFLSALIFPHGVSATIYAPGETLEPDCAPGSINCGVAVPAASGSNSDITTILGLTTPLSAPQGGTGISSYTIGDLLFAFSSSSLGKLGIGSDGQVLKVAGGLPTWSANNAATATALETARTINGVSFDGTTNIALTTADIADSLNKRYITDAGLTVLGNTSGTNTGDQDLSGLLVKSSNLSDLTSVSTARTNLGLGSLATQSGTFSGTFSGTSSGTNTGDQTTITGNAGTATALQTARTINGISFDGTTNIALSTADIADSFNKRYITDAELLNLSNTSGTNTGDQDLSGLLVKSSNLSDLTSASTARINLGLGSLATQSGTFSGTSSGTNTGDQINISGNAATVTTNANLTGAITSVGNGTSLGAFSSSNLATALTNETGTGLVVFGTAPTFSSDITIGTTGTSTGSIKLKGITSGTVNLTTAAAAGTYTLTLPTDDGTASQFLQTDGSGALAWVSIPGGGDALTISPLSQFASTTSAQLASVISDETGSGALVFASSPVFTTPNIGNATGNISGSSGSTTGNAITATALQTARTISGVSFDGTANISLTTANISDSLNKRYVTDAELTNLGNTSGVNTGDQDLSGLLVKSANLSDLTSASTARTNLGLGSLATQSGTFSGTSSGINTGDQTTITGNAGTATALQTARTINGVSFDGTANITVTAAAGTLSGSTLASNVLDSSLTSVGTLAGLTILGTSNNNTSGSSAVNIGTATYAGTITIGNVTTGDLALNDANWSITGPGTATFASINGPLTGNVTGNVSGSSGSTSGNASTATALQTARTINGVSFDGTGNITLTAAAGTLTGTTLASGVVSSSLTSVGTLVSLAATSLNAGSGTVQTTGSVFGNNFDRSTAGILTFGDTNATSISFGNTTTNPTFSFLGSGLSTFNDGVTVNGALTIPNYTDFTATSNPAYAQGRLFWDNTLKSLSYNGDVSGLQMNLGRQLWFRVKNSTGVTIDAGKVVYVTGNDGTFATVALAKADNPVTSRAIGITAASIADGAYGYVMSKGLIPNLDTSAFSSGDPIFLSSATAGEVTITKPTVPNYSVFLGTIQRGNPVTGSILANISAIDTGSVASGSLAFGGTDGFTTQDNTNLFWNDTTNRFGIGDNTPAKTFTIGNGTPGSNKFNVDGATGDVSTLGDIDLNSGGGTVLATGGDLILTTATTNNINLDSGTTGSILIGTGVAAKTITIGNAADDTFSLNSSGLNVTSAGDLTGVASIDTISASATALTFAGAGTLASTGANALTINGGTSGVLNLNNTSSGNVLIAGGSGSTGCTITNATGALACDGAVTGSNISGSNTGDQTTITGNAGTATALATARTINSISFDGTSNITVTAAAGTLSGSTLASNVLDSSLTSVGTLSGLTVTGTSNTNTSGSNATNIGTGTNAGTITIGNATTGDLALNDAQWSITGSGTATFASINGPLTGNVTGNISGSSGSTTGNASTATALQTARTINGVSFDGTSNITVGAAAGTLSGSTLASNVLDSSLTSVGTLAGLTILGTSNNNTSGSSAINIGTGTYSGTMTIGNASTGDLALNDPNWSITGAGAATFTSISGPVSGNASTATALLNPRTINGVSFDGTANIIVAAAAGTLTGATLASNVLASSLTSVGTLAGLTVTGASNTNTSGSNATNIGTGTNAGTITIGNASTGDLALNDAQWSITGPGAATFASISGPLTGNVTGNVSGSSGSTSGNAATATALQTARTINGVSFDGTANITVAAAAGTLTGATLASNVLASSLTSVGTLAGLTVTGASNTNTSGSNATNIGTGTNAGTITIGNASTGDLALNDANWSITGAGALTVASCTGCGAGGSTALSGLTAATTTNTIANANNAQTWNWGTLTTQTGMTLGGGSTMTTGKLLSVDASTYVHTTAETGSMSSFGVTDASTNTSGATVTNGVNMDTTVNTSGAGTKAVNALNVSAATLTACTTGACTWDGLKVNTQATGAASTITQNGIELNAAGIASGTLNGMKIGNITAGSGAETAVNIGTGWDQGLTIGVTPSATTGRTIDVSGNWGGNTVNDSQSLTTSTTVTESTKASSYFLANNSGTTDASVTTTFNITGLPDTNGTFAFIELKAQKGVTAGARTQEVDLKINNTLVTTVATANGTAAATLSKNFTLVRMNSVWKVVGASGNGTGGVSGGMVIKSKAADENRATVTLSNDADLFFPIGASETWSAFFAIETSVDTNTPDLNIAVTAPSGATCDMSYSLLNSPSSGAQANIGCGVASAAISLVSGTNAILFISLNVINSTTAGNVNLQFARNGASGTTTFLIGSYMHAFQNAGADIAESYYTKDLTMNSGDVVAIDSTLRAGVQKTSTTSDPKTLGVITTMPGMVLGEGKTPEGARAVFVALAGRVPVKVTTENGAIEAGDYLTSSSVPGVAMKSNGMGTVIGQAISAYDGEGVGLVTVFIKNFDTGANAVLLGDISPQVHADGTDNGLSTLVDTIKSETAHNPAELIAQKITDGKQFLTDFVVARVTAIRGYFDEVFAKKVHTDELCVKRSDGSEVCVTGDQVDAMMNNQTTSPTSTQSQTSSSSTSEAAQSPVSDTTPVESDTTGSTAVGSADPTHNGEAPVMESTVAESAVTESIAAESSAVETSATELSTTESSAAGSGDPTQSVETPVSPDSVELVVPASETSPVPEVVQP